MLKILHLGAALATALSTQVAEIPSSVKFATDTQAANATLVSQIAPNDTPQERERSGEAGTLVVLSVIAGTAAVAIAAAKANKLPSGANKQAPVLIDQASPKLRQKLLRLLHNDSAAANRLLTNIKLKNPNQSVNWAMEKAIYDLERDRGKY